VAILLTGSTGYIGAHVASNLLADHSEPLNLLVRAHDFEEARGRLWRSLQLHLDFQQFESYLNSRIRIFLGDLTDARFGLSEDEYRQLVRTTDSIIHCAASLNRKSEKSCFNVNLRGTLEVIQLAQRARDQLGRLTDDLVPLRGEARVRDEQVSPRPGRPLEHAVQSLAGKIRVDAGIHGERPREERARRTRGRGADRRRGPAAGAGDGHDSRRRRPRPGADGGLAGP